MLRRKLQIVIVFGVLALLVTSAGCHRKSSEQRAEGIVNTIAERLELNDTQKAKLSSMKEEFLAKAPAMKKTREESFDQMIGLMRSPSIDPDIIRGLAEKNRAQADELIGFILAKFSEFHAMLTPEQREKAAKEMERWREKYREYHGKSGTQ
jgi:Spy/CpxP family protein refolding chaperone